MRQNENNNWLDELLSQTLKKKTDDFDFQQWQGKFPDEVKQLRQRSPAQKSKNQTLWSLIWRTIMKSPYTKYGTVAVSLFIAAIFLFPTKEISPNSILLADVQKKILDQKNCIITGTRVLTTKEEEPQTTTLMFCKYLSFEYGYVDQTFDEQGNLLISVSVHHPNNVVTVLLPQMKRYAQFPIPGKYQEKMGEINILKLFAILFYDGDYKDLENIDLETLDITTLGCVKKSQIKDVSVVGFEVTDLPERISQGLGFERLPLFLDMQETKGCIWINPDTLLPVQFDAEVDLGKCVLTNFMEMKLSEVDDHFEWNVEMDESLFIPEIPEDYQLFGMPEMKTTAVIGVSGTAVAVPLLIWIRKRRKRRSIR